MHRSTHSAEDRRYDQMLLMTTRDSSTASAGYVVITRTSATHTHTIHEQITTGRRSVISRLPCRPTSAPGLPPMQELVLGHPPSDCNPERSHIASHSPSLSSPANPRFRRDASKHGAGRQGPTTPSHSMTSTFIPCCWSTSCFSFLKRAQFAFPSGRTHPTPSLPPRPLPPSTAWLYFPANFRGNVTSLKLSGVEFVLMIGQSSFSAGNAAARKPSRLARCAPCRG